MRSAILKIKTTHLDHDSVESTLTKISRELQETVKDHVKDFKTGIYFNINIPQRHLEIEIWVPESEDEKKLDEIIAVLNRKIDEFEESNRIFSFIQPVPSLMK